MDRSGRWNRCQDEVSLGGFTGDAGHRLFGSHLVPGEGDVDDMVTGRGPVDGELGHLAGVHVVDPDLGPRWSRGDMDRTSGWFHHEIPVNGRRGHEDSVIRLHAVHSDGNLAGSRIVSANGDTPEAHVLRPGWNGSRKVST